MSESTTKVILTVAVVGVLLYFAVKMTAPKTVVRPPSTAGAGTALKASDVSLWGALTAGINGAINLFGKSTNTATTPVPTSTTGAVDSGFNTQFAGQPLGTQTISGRVVDAAGDTIAPTDLGVGGPTQSEIDLGIGPSDWG